MAGHRFLLARRSRPSARDHLRATLGEAGRRIRQHLDSEDVLRVATEEVHRALAGAVTTTWLTRGREAPRLGCALPPSAPATDPDVPRPVTTCARRWRPVCDRRGGGLAAPIMAPRSGLLGVVHVAGDTWGDDEEAFLVAIGEETGLALEAANLYEQAVAEKEKSEAILTRVTEALIVTDPRGRIAQWNPAAEYTVGCPAREAVGRGCAEVLGLGMGEGELDCSRGCALLAVADATSPLGAEVWRQRADGRRQPLLASVSVVRDPDGNVADVVHTLRDVTKLKEADEAKTLFLATASHELKTPLTVIYGFAQTLLRVPDWEGAERDQAIEAMARRARELNQIVDRLLLSSRIEAGRAEVQPTVVDLEPILKERVGALGAVVGREITLDLDPDLEGFLPSAYVDPDAITTVVDHLLDNALKYSPSGGPVTVRASADEHHVGVAVSDRGIGMSPDEVARCFEKFWQAESTDVRRYGGTGIGLFIVHSLVEAMGGHIEVESEVGAGTTFTVTVPRTDAVLSPIEPEPSLPAPDMPEPSVIREFMRQIGVPTRRS